MQFLYIKMWKTWKQFVIFTLLVVIFVFWGFGSLLLLIAHSLNICICVYIWVISGKLGHFFVNRL